MSTVAESRIAETVDRYLAAWNERSPGRRRALIADTWVDQGYYVDPHRRGEKHDGIDAMIQAVQERFPTYRFRLSSAVDVHNDRVRSLLVHRCERIIDFIRFCHHDCRGDFDANIFASKLHLFQKRF